MSHLKKTVQILIVMLLTGCSVAAEFPSLGQGQMSGRVTENTVILQSRLTKGTELIEGDLPGAEGTAYFQISRREDFAGSFRTEWMDASRDCDHIIKAKVTGLAPATRYYYRLVYGPDRKNTREAEACTFKTLGGEGKVSFAVVTGMNYFFFQEGNYRKDGGYKGPDKHLGYPALASMLKLSPDFFCGTGDTVYFDHPAGNGDRYTGLAWSDRAKTEPEMRRKYHEQFVQPRFADLFAKVPTYWEIDDHDYRYNDCDNTSDKEPSPQLGRKNFREQLPVVDPTNADALTYGTFRINRHLQIWILEGRQYRSPNKMPDGPEKSIWGKNQRAWLKKTLLASDATFKILVSPTPLIGPDDRGKKDNHTNIGGFRYEGDEFFQWLADNRFDKKNFYICCGDRHWQYHAIHPGGFEEFSCGSIVEENSRLGVKAGDPKSTDPQDKIKQPYCVLEPIKPYAGFLIVTVTPGDTKNVPIVEFALYDEDGGLRYSQKKNAR
ncbi:MAG: alkaline phosphatase D family protein [Sedimentisphaerales bacterium]|nr:alkaline phosphatase D family protein [Sedimentisphaerales bacterium]